MERKADRAAREYAEEVGREVTQRLSLSLVAAHVDPSERTCTLPAPSEMADRLGDLLLGAGEGRNEIADLLAPFWSAEKTREALGSPSRAALADRRKNGTLLGLKTTDGVIVYPVAQFERRGGRVQVKAGLRPFLTGLKAHDPWSVALLLHTPAPELDDLTPLEWVRKGLSPDPLRDYARRVAAEWSR